MPVKKSRYLSPRRYVWLLVALFLLVRVAGSLFEGASSASLKLVPIPRGSQWVATWGASPQAATPGNLSQVGFRDATIREIVYTSAGGVRVRVRLSNAFGTAPLRIDRAALAVQAAGPRTVPGTGSALWFDGGRSVVIPPGAQVTSDAVPLAIGPGTHLAVTLYLPGPTGPVTQHADAQQDSYVAGGLHMDGPAGAFHSDTQSWYFVAGVDVLSPHRTLGSVVALGDAITDGVGSPADANARWPNFLAHRLNARSGATLAVIDEGIGGNRVLSGARCCGDSAIARFERDVGRQPGARDVIMLEGVDDLGAPQSRGSISAPRATMSGAQIIEGYERIVTLAHTDGLRIFGGTLTPFERARDWTPAREAEREAVNNWIRASGAFDGVIDFASAVADGADPQRLARAYDSGDHLHPNAAGYKAMAAAINLGALLGDE
jgi:lysophospholipase L1-like esterase